MEACDVVSSKLIDYIPYFEREDSQYYYNNFGRFTYETDVNYFFISVINECYKFETFWQDYVEMFDYYYENHLEIEEISIETLKKILITLKSLERYRHGIIAKSIDNGLILTILNRLKMLS